VLTPEQLSEEFVYRLERYTELYNHHQRHLTEPCQCARMMQGRCLRCQKLESLKVQLAQTRSLPLDQIRPTPRP
jgi:hypothetical protein